MELVKATRQRGNKVTSLPSPRPSPQGRGGYGLATRRRGIAAVEFALVASLLFMLLIGLIDYGFIFLKAQQITQAARAGARAAALPDATADTVNAAIDAAMADAGITTYTPVVTPGLTVSPGTAVKVTLTVPTAQLALIDTAFIPVPANLTAAASMAKEQ
jgi:Flp pilus assembly protein TadG